MDAIIIKKSAKELDDSISIDECIKVAKTYCSKSAASDYESMSEYYDTAITVFVMSINKSLTLSKQIEINADFYSKVDNHSKEASDKFTLLVDCLNNNNYDLCDFNDYCRYLNKLIKYIILDNFNIHSDEEYDQYDQIDREWDIREFMKNFIQKNNYHNLNQFNNKYKIQIPYIYMLVHDFGYLWGKRELDDKSERQVPKTNSILFENTVFDRIKQCITNIRNDFIFVLINLREYVSFPISDEFNVWDNDILRRKDFYECNLLPNLRYNYDNFGVDYSNYYNWNERKKIINPIYYNAIPLVPLQLEHTPTPKEAASYLIEILRQDMELEQIKKKLSKLNILLNKVRDGLRCENYNKSNDEIDNEILEKLNACINNNITSSTDLGQIDLDLASMFGETWNKFEESTKTSLKSAEYLWKCCNKLEEDDDFDYSGICISATCALENELKKIFYIDYKEYCMHHINDSNQLPSYFVDEKKPFTLGSLQFYFDNSKYGKNKQALSDYLKSRSAQNNDPLHKFTHNRYYNNKTVIELCEDIKNKYRNPSAHPHKINYETAKECYNIIVNKVEAQQDLNSINNILMILYDILK